MSAGSNDEPIGLRIDNARVFNPCKKQLETASVTIRDGRIVSPDASVDKSIDGGGGIVSPGFIDLCCNLREPGNGQKGTIASESRAAARGGYTTVCAAPDSSPVNDSSAIAHLIREVAERDAPIRILPLGAATRSLKGELLSDMVGLTSAGCVALSNGSAPLANARVLRRCMAYAQTFRIPLMLQPHNVALAADGFAHDGHVTTRLGLLGVPEVAETTAVMEMILLAEETGARLHLSQITCARSVTMMADARQRGIPVTADVAIHHLLFTEDALAGFDSRFHVQPPLRSEADRQALVQGIADGTISAIVSQHQPHDPVAKRAPLGETEPGLSTIESVFSLGLLLVDRNELTLEQLLGALTAGPATVLGLPVPELTPGNAADLCLIDRQASWTPTAETLLSVGKHAPVLGTALPGCVIQSWSNGCVAFGSL